MKAVLVIFISTLPFTLFAQEDLLKELEKAETPHINYATQAFNGSRIINGQSVETIGKGNLEFIFSHRFGRVNSGSYNLWGLDAAFVRLGLEYGITDRLGLAIGRTSTDKTFDGYLRYKLARQSNGARIFPVTITAIGSTYVKTSPQMRTNPLIEFQDRIAYAGQILFARRFSKQISAQINAIFVHRNAVSKAVENNDDYALSFGGRYKITNSVSLTGEYFYRLNPHEYSPYFNSVGLGVDIETGGHVFQLVFTNSMGMNDRAIVTETDGKFGRGDILFGFNISREF